MKKIQAPTLEDALRQACKHFGCSVTELRYEVVQYPSKGLLGLFGKPAIIVADHAPASVNTGSTQTPKTPRESSVRNEDRSEASSVQSPSSDHTASPGDSEKQSRSDDASTAPSPFSSNDTTRSLVEDFFHEAPDHIPMDESALARHIEERLKEMIEKSCFDIDVVEVDVEDGTAYVFIDGEDAALLIGKEGYRYNALSYMLYNWIHGVHGLKLKLEIAHFLTSQEEMIRNYLVPIIERVHSDGWARTKALDGILVHIALEQLREAFPHKYVAIRKNRDGSRYVLVTDFHKHGK
ncbi:Jag N-terminal domain-containing protein [Nitratifractor sp.]